MLFSSELLKTESPLKNNVVKKALNYTLRQKKMTHQQGVMQIEHKLITY